MTTAISGRRVRGPTCAAVLVWICALALSAPARAADEPQVWIEITSPHFVVVSNAGDKKAREVAQQFEQIRSVYQTTLPRSRLDPTQPLIILAVENEKDLRELLPEHWERRGQFHPAGKFQ